MKLENMLLCVLLLLATIIAMPVLTATLPPVRIIVRCDDCPRPPALRIIPTETPPERPRRASTAGE